MTALDLFLCVLGLSLLAAGIWWLWGHRWAWVPFSRTGARFRDRHSEPTRVVVGMVHLILGYHLVVWSIPLRTDHRPIQVPRQSWPWLVLGCTGVMAGSMGLDRFSVVGSDHPHDSEP